MPTFFPSDPDDRSFQALVHRAPIMIWMAGLDMGRFYFNRAWLNFRGRLLAEEYGTGWLEGIHPEDRDRCLAHYTACFQERVPFVMHYRLRHFSGQYFWIVGRGTPHYSIGGAFLGFFGGCAETADIAPAALNSELRTSLAQVADFARELAQAQVEQPPADEGRRSPLASFVHHLRQARAEHASEMKHMIEQLEKLADDLLAHGTVPQGSYLR
jgi:PAS domain S-box-containing protein